MTALRLASKSSSVRTRSAASFAAEHPDPIARPTSALSRAVTSLIPSPVTDTHFPWLLSPVTSKSLSDAVALARTLRFWETSLKAISFSTVGPSPLLSSMI